MNITTTTETWYCFAVQYWKDGNTHVSSMDDVFSTLEDNTDEAFKYLIDKRLASHPSRLVYEGVIIPRTKENEKYFQEIEDCPNNRFKTMGHKILSIWKYSFKELGEEEKTSQNYIDSQSSAA